MRLRSRLSLFFLIAIATGSIASLALVRLSTENLFRSFVFSGDSAKARVYATILGDYYATNGGWEGLQSFIADIPRQVLLAFNRSIHGERGSSNLSAYPLDSIQTLLADRIAVADARGVIVADTDGKLLGTVHPPRHLAHGYAILANFERVGTVLVGSMVDSSLTGIDERFLASITASLLWATLAASLIALVLGLIFAARITGPLASLSAAVRRVAAGDLATPVVVAGEDELSGLSSSFNAMTGELRRLEEAKKRIIADAAHELRTPVTLIQGTIEAMIDGIYPMDAATLASVHEETIRLSRLIDTLRELETIESGELVLELEDLDPLELAHKALALFTSQATGRGISLSVETPGGRPPRLVADYLRLSEVLYNLLSNAIKYSPSGSLIRIRLWGEEGGMKPALLMAIEDSGPGIPLSERERVFERFYRIDRSRSQDSGGRGLGLAIASEIVKAHGGSLTAGDSGLGGAAFIVRLPASG